MQPSSTTPDAEKIMPANEVADVNREVAQRVAAAIGDENRAIMESTDPLAPAEGYSLVYTVGLGGSAGSIPALQKFFEQMPPESDMAYVVVLHLSPDYESQLAEILQQSTLMPVLQVTERVLVEANHVYVIPPRQHLQMDDGHIGLTPPQQQPGQRLAVDLFFRTLAQTHGPRAVGVVLSGGDGDGAIGLKRIKEHGGLSIAQDPNEAQHDSMPRSAIATGIVDWILPVGAMAAKLCEFRRNEDRMQLPPMQLPPVEENEHVHHETALREVLSFLHTRTGHDFAHYKRATVLRRLERRLQVSALPDLPAYLIFLRTHPGEAAALLQDLLISVTNFFRDRDAFDVLETEIARLFRGKSAGDTVRVWVTGCATGEEAYSVAMLLSEHAAKLEEAPKLQIFATDIDEEAIAQARDGRYPATIAADVSAERLRRFFTPDHGGFRVRKELREMILFAAHNLLSDSPFSRIDLITCRNLLIYFNREAQERTFNTFHFALRSGGLLFLGNSESVDEDGLFSAFDKKHRLFSRRDVRRLSLPLPQMVRPTLSGPSLPGPAASLSQAEQWPVSSPTAEMEKPRSVSFGELHLKLLEQYAPPSVLVNDRYDIVHLSEHAGRFLQFGGGEISTNLLKVVHPRMRVELRTALFRAVQQGSDIKVLSVPFQMGDSTTLIDLHVRPLLSPAATQSFLLVIFDEREPNAPALPTTVVGADVEPVAQRLEEEVEYLKGYLNATTEQHETAGEELKASNEELQAINEELRSATEELETGKEELQSINEELTTVNQELKSKVEEVSRAHSDVQNLMAATEIAIIFLDRALHIRRYTPRAVGLFQLLPTDVGRPLSDLRHNLDYDHLARDAQQVLDHLSVVEQEIQARDGRWFLSRLLPYRSGEDRIDGVVLTFVDISARKHAREELHQSQRRFRLLVEDVQDYAIFMIDVEGRLCSWNSGVERLLGYREDEFIGRDASIIFTPEDRASGQPAKEEEEARINGRAIDERWHARKDGSHFWVSGVMTALHGENGELQAYCKIMRDQTEAKRIQDELRRAHDELEARVAQRTEELLRLTTSLQTEISERREAEAQREQSEQRRGELLKHIVSAQEDERRRISRELHDQMGQQLTALMMGLKALPDLPNTHLSSPSLNDRIQTLQDLTSVLMEQTHKLAWELRPAILDTLGLQAALSHYVQEWSQQNGIGADFISRGPNVEHHLPTPLETTLYRVVQEALTNVQRHAQASNVSVLLEGHENTVIVIVEDNGRGFDLETEAKTSTRLGLLGMQERLELVSGTLTVESTPAGGTTIYASAPIERRQSTRE